MPSPSRIALATVGPAPGGLPLGPALFYLDGRSLDHE